MLVDKLTVDRTNTPIHTSHTQASNSQLNSSVNIWVFWRHVVHAHVHVKPLVHSCTHWLLCTWDPFSKLKHKTNETWLYIANGWTVSHTSVHDHTTTTLHDSSHGTYTASGELHYSVAGMHWALLVVALRTRFELFCLRDAWLIAQRALVGSCYHWRHESTLNWHNLFYLHQTINAIIAKLRKEYVVKWIQRDKHKREYTGSAAIKPREWQ